MNRIGMIGLGNAGSPLGQRLLQKGYALTVYDLDPKAMEALANRGARVADSPREATQEVTLMVLPSYVEVKEAAWGEQGVLQGLQPGSILIDLSGTDPECAKEMAAIVTERRAHFLGATLHAAGAPAVTIPNGLLSIVIGGKKEAIEACAQMLKDLSERVICLPEPWAPKSLKIATMMIAQANNIILAEVSTWLTAQGIAPQLFLEVAQTTGSRATASRLEGFLKRNKSYGGALSNSYKDLLQALKVAAELKIPLPLTGMAAQISEMARAHGLARTNSPAAIGGLYEILTGVSLENAVIEGERHFPEPRESEILYLGKW